MAEFLWTFAAEEMLKKVVKLAAEQIGLTWGLEKELSELTEWVLKAETFLCDIKTTKSYQDSVKLWVEKLQNLVNEADDILDKLVYEDLRRKTAKQKMNHQVHALVSACNNAFFFRGKMAKRIKSIKELLRKHCCEVGPLGLVSNGSNELEIEISQLRETVSELDDFEIVGRNVEVESIVKQVMDARNKHVTSILPIVGMGGLGKTTLAKLVFNHPKIKRCFDETIWVCVSEPFLINKILGTILQTLKGTSSGLDNKEALLRALKSEMHGKNYFLVLDDVWNENPSLWDELKNCLMKITEKSENSFVVTTRSAEVAKIVETLPSHHLSKLSDDQCWSLFRASSNANELPTTSSLTLLQEELVKKIGGIPLVARVLGRALKFQGNYDEWVTMLKSEIRKPFEEENFVLYILKLSVDRLPSYSLKQCFAYCSNFPKGFEFEKEQLIQMWIAQGFIHLKKGRSNKTLEDEGDMYFKMLLSRCLFQDVNKDDRGRIISCKMHDLVHDIACDVSNNKSFQSEHGNALEMKRWTSKTKKFARQARTILCYEQLSSTIEKMICDKLFYFVRLRVLVMNSWDIYQLPDSIHKLMHLRYLDVFHCTLEKLPDSLVLLYNLQTLRIDGKHIEELPKNLRQLVSLRHFELSNWGASYTIQMPPHLSQLTQLQTLSIFAAGSEEGCKITELGPLKNLKGSLKLINLEHVKCKEEAESANLVEKENLRDLDFIWSWNCLRKVNNHNDLEVLKGFQPHGNLQHLKIQCFQGKVLPNEIFVDNLVAITLFRCQNCERLPMLGQLTNLEELHISHLYCVQSIGNEFYGNNNSNQMILFPKLKKLILERMDYLKQWEEVRVGSNVKTFPHLQVLKVSDCPMLLNIPNMFGFCDENGVKNLRVVEILECFKLTKLPNGLQLCHSIQDLRIKQCCSCLTLNLENRNFLSSLRILLPEKLLQLTNLKMKEVIIFGCLQHYGPLNLCSSAVLRLPVGLVNSLQDLSVQNFVGNIEALPRWLENLTSLQTLSLSFCINCGD